MEEFIFTGLEYYKLIPNEKKIVAQLAVKYEIKISIVSLLQC